MPQVDHRFVDPWFGTEPWYKPPKDYSQLEIEYFFPLTEQVSLDLDYEGCDTKLSTTNYVLRDETCFTLGTTTISNITPQLTITPNNPVGTLSIGGMNIGLEKKPNYFQRLIHNLLGFNWKDK